MQVAEDTLTQLWYRATQSHLHAATARNHGYERLPPMYEGQATAYLDALSLLLQAASTQPAQVNPALALAWATPAKLLPDWQQIINPAKEAPHA